MKSRIAAAFSVLLVTGCVGVGTSNLTVDKSVVLLPRVLDSQYTTKGEVVLYTSDSIDHLVLNLIESNIVRATKPVPKADLLKPVTFSNLKASRTYKVQAYAYSSADDSATISVDANSFVNIVVGTSDTPAVGNIPVKLIDIPFNGYGTSTISITPGGYSYAASESIATGSP